MTVPVQLFEAYVYLYIHPELLVVGIAVTEGFGVLTTVTVGAGACVGGRVGMLSWLPRLTIRVLKLAKFTDPQPVTGSHPLLAVNPLEQQDPSCTQRLLPLVTSFANWLLYLYREGLIHPRPPLPAATRAAFTRDTIPEHKHYYLCCIDLITEERSLIPANAGAEADVPYNPYSRLFKTTR